MCSSVKEGIPHPLDLPNSGTSNSCGAPRGCRIPTLMNACPLRFYRYVYFNQSCWCSGVRVDRPHDTERSGYGTLAQWCTLTSVWIDERGAKQIRERTSVFQWWCACQSNSAVSEMSNEILQPFERLGITREALLYKLQMSDNQCITWLTSLQTEGQKI